MGTGPSAFCTPHRASGRQTPEPECGASVTLTRRPRIPAAWGEVMSSRGPSFAIGLAKTRASKREYRRPIEPVSVDRSQPPPSGSALRVEPSLVARTRFLVGSSSSLIPSKAVCELAIEVGFRANSRHAVARAHGIKVRGVSLALHDERCELLDRQRGGLCRFGGTTKPVARRTRERHARTQNSGTR